jgi:TRAP transporter TAXI family solute receptor
MLGFSRWYLFGFFAAMLCIVAIVCVALSYFIPAVPLSVTLATGFKGSSFEAFGRRYQEILARSHVELTLRETSGALENLKLLQDPDSGVAAALVTGGIANGKEAPGVLSLGLIDNNPFWIFYMSEEPLERLSQLKGKRIAVGPQGSGTRFAAERILGKAGINSETATLLPFGGSAAVDALKQGIVDVVWYNGGPGASAVHELLQNPQVRLMDFPLTDAFTRSFVDVSRFELPQGAISIDPMVPPHDIRLIGTNAKVLIRGDLHPEIVYLLLQAMKEVHAGKEIFQNAGEFPNGGDTEYPVAASASDFYKNGPSFLQRHLPLWLNVYVQRAIAVLLTVIAVGLPLFGYAPRLYRWLIEYRLGSTYRSLRVIEASLQTDIDREAIAALAVELDRLDREVSNHRVPIRHSDIFFRVKSDLHLVRMRLRAQRPEWQDFATIAPQYANSTLGVNVRFWPHSEHSPRRNESPHSEVKRTSIRPPANVD